MPFLAEATSRGLALPLAFAAENMKIYSLRFALVKKLELDL